MNENMYVLLKQEGVDMRLDEAIGLEFVVRASAIENITNPPKT